MDNAGYIALTRQTGLMREMQAVAQNIANLSTTGYRREGLVFAEYVRSTDRADSTLSMATLRGRSISPVQGALTRTGARFDFAIEGDGYFLVETAAGERLTRAGSFMPDAAGELVTPQGHRLLDAGGAPVFVPPDARDVSLAADGTLSADGQPLALIGLVRPTDPVGMQREAGVLFDAGNGGVEPVFDAALLQGFVEESNVEAVSEIARMIEVQRAYELGQQLLDREDERIRTVVQTLGR
jgi:flagellar basal-body rod protein FlgF